MPRSGAFARWLASRPAYNRVIPKLACEGAEEDHVLAVLDAYIIEEIKKREEQRRQTEDHERPRLRIDIEKDDRDRLPEDEKDDQTDPIVRIEI